MRLRALLRTQPRRALLQSAQALPRYRHTLRQTRQKFPCRSAASCDYNLAQLKTGPSAHAAINPDCAHGCLAAQKRRGKYIAGNEQSEIAGRVEVRAQACGKPHGDFLDFEFARERDVAAGREGRVIIDARERPSRLLWRRREAPEEAGNPEAHAALVGGCNRRRAHESAKSKNEMPKPRTRHAVPPRDFDNPTWLHGVRMASDHTHCMSARGFFADCGEPVTLARLWPELGAVSWHSCYF